MRCFFAFILMCFALTGCTPYVDSRREAGVAHLVGQSQAPTIAVCYNGLITNEAELQGIANKACLATNKEAKRTGTRYFNCALFTPNTAIFQCQEPIKP